MAQFKPKISEDDLTETVLAHWRQHHPKRLTGNPKQDRQDASRVAQEALETARIYVEKLAYSNDQAMSEVMREVVLV